MKTAVFMLFVAMVSALSQDIRFTNKTVSFTNLEGRVYSNVTVVKGDLDGLIWRDENGSGGRVCYTNLHPAVLESLGVPTNRMALARARAERKAVLDARYRAYWTARYEAEARAKAEAEAKWAAGAPAREREAQRQAMLARIETLRARIQAADRQIKRADAMTLRSAAGDPMAQRFQVNLAADQVEKAKQQLDRLQAEYRETYSDQKLQPKESDRSTTNAGPTGTSGIQRH